MLRRSHQPQGRVERGQAGVTVAGVGQEPSTRAQIPVTLPPQRPGEQRDQEVHAALGHVQGLGVVRAEEPHLGPGTGTASAGQLRPRQAGVGEEPGGPGVGIDIGHRPEGRRRGQVHETARVQRTVDRPSAGQQLEQARAVADRLLVLRPRHQPRHRPILTRHRGATPPHSRALQSQVLTALTRWPP